MLLSESSVKNYAKAMKIDTNGDVGQRLARKHGRFNHTLVSLYQEGRIAAVRRVFPKWPQDRNIGTEAKKPRFSFDLLMVPGGQEINGVDEGRAGIDKRLCLATEITPVLVSGDGVFLFPVASIDEQEINDVDVGSHGE